MKAYGSKIDDMFQQQRSDEISNEINRMIRDSEIFAEGDRKIKERADAKNDFESSVFSY